MAVAEPQRSVEIEADPDHEYALPAKYDIIVSP